MFDTDILVVVRNQIDVTKRCLESVFRNVSRPFHLIVIDNASTDETPTYLKQIEQRQTPRQKITIISNRENSGYAQALNQGLEFSSAPYVLFCNNDIEFYPEALSEMISIAEANPSFGLVNPNSNEFGVMNYNSEFLKSQKGKWVERCHTSGFCVLVKRAVIQKIGGIDLTFNPAYFEDMDYAERAKHAGFLCVVAKGAYVHHSGTRTFLPVEKQRLWEKHREIFNQRWGGTQWFCYLGDRETLLSESKQKRISAQLLNVARTEIAIIYLIMPQSAARLICGLHDSFRTVPTPYWAKGLVMLGKILSATKKKPISRIYVSNPRAFSFWNRLSFFHRTEVRLLENDSTALS